MELYGKVPHLRTLLYISKVLINIDSLFMFSQGFDLILITYTKVDNLMKKCGIEIYSVNFGDVYIRYLIIFYSNFSFYNLIVYITFYSIR
jgi:hypothetical protein